MSLFKRKSVVIDMSNIHIKSLEANNIYFLLTLYGNFKISKKLSKNLKIFKEENTTIFVGNNKHFDLHHFSIRINKILKKYKA